MSSKDTEPGVSAINPVESPGRLLAAARESHSLSPADLAARLRLDTKIVMALERGDFENLPAPTFIKGYIRAIAKELDIDPQQALDAYEAHAVIEPPPLADFSTRAPDQIGVNSTIIKAVTYALTAILILLIALWWRSNYQNDDGDKRAASLGEIAEENRAEPLSYTYAVVDHPDTGWQFTTPDIDAPENTEDPAEFLMSEDTSGELGFAPSNRLVLSTTGEAWIEVYDADDNKLHYGLAKKGTPIEIDNEEYYRLVLGNTTTITLHFNGAEIDLAQHSQDGVAQMELGTAPGNDVEEQ